MSIEDYPLRAKDGMTITMSETFIKLVQLTIATNSQSLMNDIMGDAEIPSDHRLILQDALSDRMGMLRDMLRSQVSALNTLRRQGG